MKKEVFNKEYLNRLDQYALGGMDHQALCLLRFEPGETVLTEGSRMEHIMIVVQGMAKVGTSTSSGKEILLSYYISEGILGDIELTTGSCYATTNVVALDHFTCIGLPYAKCAQQLNENLNFVNLIAAQLAYKLLRISRNSTITALNSVEERLCAFLIEYSKGTLFSLTLSDTARSIGSSYRQLLRVISKLCQERVLQKEHNGYRILDMQKISQKVPDYYLK